VLLSLYAHLSRPFWTGLPLAYPAVQKTGAAAVTYESGGIARAEYQLDLYPEARMAALLAMADDLKSDRLLALVPSVVDSMVERWEETVPDFEETTSILSCMEEAAWSKARLDPKLYEKIRERMFAELEHTASFYDFWHVEEFLKDTGDQPTDAENQTMGLAFQTYIKSQFRYDLSDTEGEALDEMANFISKMMKKYGYDLSHEHESVMEKIVERDEQEDHRPDEEYSHWRDQHGFERADEESISSMFDSLR
jgi:hypothetical protein